MLIIPTFPRPVQTLHNLVCWAFSLSEGSCFECGLFINFGAIILYKRIMADKDVCPAHTFSSVDCNFSFCMQTFYLIDDF